MWCYLLPLPLCAHRNIAYIRILITGRITYFPEGWYVLSTVLHEPEGMSSVQCCSQREEVRCDFKIPIQQESTNTDD